MREIKFRFWDRDNNEMSDICKLGDDLRWLLSDLHIPMQFTGLYDTNGKEIYEGDVLSRPYFRPNTQERIVRIVKADDYGWDLRDYAVSICEVIGNIYENPELLNASSAS